MSSKVKEIYGICLIAGIYYNDNDYKGVIAEGFKNCSVTGVIFWMSCKVMDNDIANFFTFHY